MTNRSNTHSVSRRSVLRAGLAAGAGAVVGLTQSPPAGATRRAAVAFVGATVIDTSGGPSRPDQTVVVEGDRISRLGGRRDVRVPPAATVVDGTGRFLIPGLCDMHVHSDIYEGIIPPLYIANGVTTVREMSGADHLHRWRDQVDAGTLLGPASIIASPLIDGAPGLWAGLNAVSYIEVTTEAEARAAVRRVVRDGADFVKVYSRLSPRAYFAVADEARRQRVPFVGHCPDNVPITRASAAGQRSLEHMWGTWYSTSGREAELRRAIADIRIEAGDYNNWFNQIHPVNWLAANSIDPGKAAAVFAEFVANGSRQVPTLIAMRAIAMPDEVSRTDARLKYLPAVTAQEWWWALDELFAAGRGPTEVAQHRELFDRQLELVDAMRRAGVPMLAGTDSATPGCFPGFALHDELALLVRAGLSPLEALQAATLEPARFLGRQDHEGTIRRGNVANLVLLDADPLDDIRNTQRIRAVVVRGRLVSAEDRTRMLLEVEAAARQVPADAAATVGCPCMGPARRRDAS
ncbi:amidohydrolase family protein [Asanoa sp. NPDC049518]|uniref:amidohydrolase family protein n=1 Tax=unclassified Asanoa TaxID=2685164 RepID=UPI00341ED824